jgi:hypothetical protein
MTTFPASDTLNLNALTTMYVGADIKRAYWLGRPPITKPEAHDRLTQPT